jgi:hypothetical protein
MKMLIDIWMDGYETKEEHKNACIQFVKDQLDFTAASVKIHWVEDVKE